MDTDLQENNEVSGGDFGGFDQTPPAVSSIEPSSPLPVVQDKYSIHIEDDNSPLSIYQTKHNKFLDEKSAKSEQKRQEHLTEANVTIENFYKRRTEEREAKHIKNRQSEEKFLKENTALLQGTGGNEWERISKLIDFKQAPVGRDTTRLRKLLLDLKH